MRPVQTDPDIAATAALIGDPSRAAILMALADGRALPAGELARYARISPQTASTHLDRLFKGNLISVAVQGRHHYYRLRDERVAQMIERLAAIAPSRPAFTPTQRREAQTLRFARTCYGHLAGRLGVAVSEAFCRAGFLIEDDSTYRITEPGKVWFGQFGVAVDFLRNGTKRPLTRWCIDWSERRHHLAGSLGVALTQRLFEINWIVR
ncbi:MAG TPA: winged helix-turn-helix domain-containing protein, partial [Candidatus Binataceae bacterium]|nr:winged helix-turn-helix domain-containing protein [Candidatus Binataceae bacterium]